MVFVVFVQDIWYEFLGVMYLSAILKKNGHKTEIIFGNKKSILQQIKKLKPDLIMFSSMTLQHKWVSEVSLFLKKRGIKTPIVVGGPHVTFFPEFIDEPGIDIVCRGEGEYAILELTEAIHNKKDFKKIKNLWVKDKGKIYKNPLRPLIKNLDELPYPDREIYKKYDFFKGKDSEVFLAMRGCPYNCSFCFNHSWNNTYSFHNTMRFRSVDNVIDEISQVVKKYKVNTVMFVDSSFNLNKEWILEFLKKYKKRINVQFSINVRANLIDEEVVKAIADTKRCASVRFAIEVGSERLRNDILRKGLTDKQIMNAVRLFKKYKLNIIVFNMFGLPTETTEDAYETIKMNRKINPAVISCYVFVPFPGLDITKDMLKKGIITTNDFARLGVSPYKMHRSVLKQKDINEVNNLHKFNILAARFPFFLPLIKQLIKLPPNRIYDYVYNISQGLEWMKWMRVGPVRFAIDALKNYKKVS